MSATTRPPPANVAANDTEAPSNLPVGGTFETSSWRIHRFSDSVRITHILHAGARGKKCLEITIRTSYGRDLDLLDLLVSHMLQVVLGDPQPATLAAVARDAPLLSSAFETTVSELRGVDVESHVVKVESELVHAHFSAREFRITVTAVIPHKQGTVRQDSHLYNRDIRSAAKAYEWARANAARMGTMTRSEIYTALRDAGARVNTWG